MERIGSRLVTPIYLKTSPEEPWPEGEKVFYSLTKDGLFLCRDHQFFRSCVRAPRGPAELAEEKCFLEPRYPMLSQRKVEEVVGFFDAAWQTHGGESAVFLAWNRKEERVQVIVPRQVATIRRSWRGNPYPVGLHYTVPEGLPDFLTIFCDIHSHCDFAAYTSRVDADDEIHRAGLHAVVGRLDLEPPDFHVESVVDGARMRLDRETVFGGYRRRRFDFPRSWLGKVEARELR